jgi:hypothetical protein
VHPGHRTRAFQSASLRVCLHARVDGDSEGRETYRDLKEVVKSTDSQTEGTGFESNPKRKISEFLFKIFHSWIVMNVKECGFSFSLSIETPVTKNPLS